MTADILIRQYRPDDVDQHCEAVIESKAELIPWMSWCGPDYSREQSQSWVEGRPAAWEKNEEWSFVIVDGDDRILGTTGIHRLDLRNGVGELGYWVRSSATGRGVATAAARMTCQWAFSEKRLHRIEVLVSTENLASQRVAVKAGGTPEGKLLERLFIHNRRQDCVLFAILNNPQ